MYGCKSWTVKKAECEELMFLNCGVGEDSWESPGLIWKDPDAGKHWGQEEKGITEDEMVGWHHWLNGHGFGWTLGVGDGHGGLVCCGSRGCKELDTTEWLNWTQTKTHVVFILWHYRLYKQKASDWSGMTVYRIWGTFTMLRTENLWTRRSTYYKSSQPSWM